jgi:antirestriction protein ArdC
MGVSRNAPPPAAFPACLAFISREDAGTDRFSAWTDVDWDPERPWADEDIATGNYPDFAAFQEPFSPQFLKDAQADLQTPRGAGAGRSRGVEAGRSRTGKRGDFGNNKAREVMNSVAASIVELIDLGQVSDEVRSAWTKLDGPPHNGATGHVYTGGNRYHLRLLLQSRRWSDPRFLTARQCQHLADASGAPAGVKPGETPISILRPKQIVRTKPVLPEEMDRIDPGNITMIDGIPHMKECRWTFDAVAVYNVAQTTAVLPPLKWLPPREWQDNDFFERFVAAAGITVFHDQPVRAFYSRKDDAVHLPSKDAFPSAAYYYATLLHEFFHATGHEDREGREIPQSRDGVYATEELRAELFSCACAATFGIDFPREVNAAYIKGWKSLIEEGKGSAILKAASEAERVFQTILDVASGVQPKVHWFPKVDFSTMPTPFKNLSAELKDAAPLPPARPVSPDADPQRGSSPATSSVTSTVPVATATDGCPRPGNVPGPETAQSSPAASRTDPVTPPATERAAPRQTMDLKELCQTVLPSHQFATWEKALDTDCRRMFLHAFDGLARTVSGIPGLESWHALGEDDRSRAFLDAVDAGTVVHLQYGTPDGTFYMAGLDPDAGEALGLLVTPKGACAYGPVSMDFLLGPDCRMAMDAHNGPLGDICKEAGVSTDRPLPQPSMLLHLLEEERMSCRGSSPEGRTLR